jgi:hypothetical protein
VLIEEGVVVTGEPANETVTAEPAENPEPVTVTMVPTMPLDGESDMIGVTVKVAEAVRPVPSEADIM